MTANPVLVEVFRGQRVESFHRGAIAVADADGRLVMGLGDLDRPIFPRSAIKVVQALPLVESGAADAYGFGAAELSIAAASHNGEMRHVETAASMLARAGRGEPDLECGAQWPERGDDVARLNRAGAKPNQLHNNCSGKHAGFVCFACHAGHDPHGYVAPDHPVQRTIRAAMEDVFRQDLSDERLMGIDGCAIPTWAIPLKSLAAGMARFGTGTGLSPLRAAAAKRILEAAWAEPFMMAGTGRFCTRFMSTLGARIYVKTGAEAVFCAAIPELGLGVALKIDDGASRASEVVMARIAARLLGLEDDPKLAPFLAPDLQNRNGAVVGRIAASEQLVP